MSFHLRRPSGIRNGGLLLVLVALAGVMALVDKPPGPGGGQRLPGVFQHLPPPAGITALPPLVGQPSTPAGGGPASSDRAHPSRKHPRPAGSGSSGRSTGDAVGRPAGGGSGGTGTSPPPGAAPPVAAPAVSVRVPSVTVRVRPPSVLGRDLAEVRAQTPAATMATPAVELPRLG